MSVTLLRLLGTHQGSLSPFVDRLATLTRILLYDFSPKAPLRRKSLTTTVRLSDAVIRVHDNTDDADNGVTASSGLRRDMIGYIDIEEQVDADFARAHRRALLRRVSNHFRKAPGKLLAFEDVRKSLRAFNQTPLGTQTVEIEKIVGTVGRRHDFDECFLPVRSSVVSRWESVDRAFQLGQDLPPVSLYKIGDAYFVNDGNHRVSVARYQDVEAIDAEVVEFRSPETSSAPPPVALSICSGWLSRISGKLKSALSV
jgi:hypothetical protein